MASQEPPVCLATECQLTTDELESYLARYGTSIEEIEKKCTIVFSYRTRKSKDEEKTRRKKNRKEPAGAGSEFEHQPRPKKRRSGKAYGPSDKDHYIKLLKNILNLIYCFKFDRKKNLVRYVMWPWCTDHKHLERALLHLMYAHGHFGQVIECFKLINRWLVTWPLSWYQENCRLWYGSHYKMGRPGKILTAVETFRIRQKNPFPIEDHVGNTRYGITNKANELLNYCYQENKKPSKDTKKELSERTGLSLENINNWFKNRRQREGKLTASQCKSESLTSATSQQSMIEEDPKWTDNPTGLYQQCCPDADDIGRSYPRLDNIVYEQNTQQQYYYGISNELDTGPIYWPNYEIA
jgi:hypothetical protein